MALQGLVSLLPPPARLILPCPRTLAPHRRLGSLPPPPPLLSQSSPGCYAASAVVRGPPSAPGWVPCQAQTWQFPSPGAKSVTQQPGSSGSPLRPCLSFAPLPLCREGPAHVLVRVFATVSVSVSTCQRGRCQRGRCGQCRQAVRTSQVSSMDGAKTAAKSAA
jgi:hypothetical protein